MSSGGAPNGSPSRRVVQTRSSGTRARVDQRAFAGTRAPTAWPNARPRRSTRRDAPQPRSRQRTASTRRRPSVARRVVHRLVQSRRRVAARRAGRRQTARRPRPPPPDASARSSAARRSVPDRLRRERRAGLRTAHGSRRALAPCRNRGPPRHASRDPRRRACATSSCTRRVLPMPGSARTSHVVPLPARLDAVERALRKRASSASRPSSGCPAAVSTRSERSFHTGISCAKPRIGSVADGVDLDRRDARAVDVVGDHGLAAPVRARSGARRGSRRRRSPCSCDGRRCRCPRRPPRRWPRRRAPPAAARTRSTSVSMQRARRPRRATRAACRCRTRPGAPNTPMTASPMCLSIVPPHSPISPSTSSK